MWITANPLFGRAMYHHYAGPDYYSFNRGGVHFIGAELRRHQRHVAKYYGHVDSLQLAWLARDLAHVSAETPVVTFNHIPLLSALNEFDGFDDGPPAPTLITVNVEDILPAYRVERRRRWLAVLRARGTCSRDRRAYSCQGTDHAIQREGVRTRFEQSPAVVGPAGAGPFVFPSGVVKYTVSGGSVGAGAFIATGNAQGHPPVVPLKPQSRRNSDDLLALLRLFALRPFLTMAILAIAIIVLIAVWAALRSCC